MGKIKYLYILPLLALILSSCNFGSSDPQAVAQVSTSVVGTATVLVPVVGLTVQATNGTDTFNTVGQIINYRYTVTNTGIVPLPGPLSVTNDKGPVTCPNINSVGNLDDRLDPNESVICTSNYSITQADLTFGAVTNVATATVGGFSSSPVTTRVSFAAQTAGPIKLTKSASPLIYSQVGQLITYTFGIQNLTTANIGPTQFTITDDKLISPINCGAAGTIIAPQQSITCTATYAISQADMTAGRVTNTATASGGGTLISAPATTTVTLGTTPPPSSSLTRGSTIPHKVVKDEWMIQIARCYGASFDAVRAANLQIVDPDVIEIDQTLTIPNIGSNGNIYGPPCVGHHTVQSGDTWTSIAQKYNADVAVLQAANLNSMPVGTVLKIPLNSAGANPIPVTGATPTYTATATATATATFTPTPTSTVAVVTLTPTPTGTVTAGQPIRITFPAGTNSVRLDGTVPAQGNVRYVLSAVSGQVLTVTVTAPVNEVGMTVTDPNGTAIKPLNTTLTWSSPLTVNGDYVIQIASILGTNNKTYTLDVSLTTPSAAR